jgi:hypothetical protein
MGNESFDALAKCRIPVTLVDGERPVAYAVVVYREADGGDAHLPSPQGSPLTSCGKIAIARLARDVLTARDHVCARCTSAASPTPAPANARARAPKSRDVPLQRFARSRP